MTDLVRTGAGTVAYADQTCSAQAWFARGERVGYDPEARAIVTSGNAPLKIFLSREGDIAQAVSFLPGFPDGSFGGAKGRPHLPNASEMSKLFFDYVGMGDSDKPKAYPYPTAERAYLDHAIWWRLGVQAPMLVAFDFSSLIVLEILRRRLERAERGKTPDGPEIRGVFIFNGGLFTDGHAQPWYTTPLLRRLPNWARPSVGRPFALFKRLPGIRKLWSKDYHVTEAELRELHDAMDGHDGLFYLAAAAGFVADHKAQGDRLDFGHLFKAYRNQLPFVVGGSDEDPFEYRQGNLSPKRLV